MNLLQEIIDWESGEMDPDREFDFFIELRNSGMLWNLQGTYQRRASELGII